MDEHRRDDPSHERPRDIGGTDPLTPATPPPSRAAPEPGASEPAAAVEAEPAGRADDYVDIYLSPKEVFERRRDGRFGQALLILIVASIVIYYLFLPAGEAIMQAEMAEQMAENPEAAEAMQRFSGTMRLIGGVFVPIGIGLMVLIFAAILKGLAAIFRIALTFRQALVITTFSGFITLLAQIAGSISIMLANRDGTVEVPRDMSFGVLRFLDQDALPAVAVPMLGLIDLFAIWTVAIVAVGVYVIGRTGKGEAIAAAAIVWVISAVPGVIGALVS